MDEGVRRFLGHYDAHLLDATRLYAGIPTLLDALHAAGVVLSVLTNKPEGLSRRLLDGLDVGARFVAIVGGDSLPTRKPDPAGVRHLAALARTAPDRMLLVGDSVIDVATAANAGVDFCGVGWGIVPEALRATRPSRIVESAEELAAMIL